jgi:hypothetical protein
MDDNANISAINDNNVAAHADAVPQKASFLEEIVGDK